MTELDQETLLSLATALAHHQVADYARRAGLGYLDDATLAPYEQQAVTALAPGLVTFAARLSAALPPDFDLASVLTQFFQDAETVAALNLYGEDATAGLAALGAALTKAGLPFDVLDPNVLSEALTAWSAASVVIAHLTAQTNANQTLANTPLYQQVRPAQDEELIAKMAELVQGLTFKGLSRIDGGDILAADGYTILFSWRRGQTAARDELPQTTGPEEFPSGAVQETNGGGLDSPSGGSAEPQPEPSSDVVALRLDTAAPPQVTVGLPFDLAAAIRQLASPTLAIADLSLTESAAFAAVLPAGDVFLAMRIQVAAPECEILGGDTRPVRILPGQDGPTVYFQLIPRRAGPLSIIVTVYQEADWIGSTRLRTEVGGGAAAGQSLATAPRGGVALTVNSQPLAPADVSQNMLWQALDKGYSLAELQDLCFELDIDYEDLPGEGQSAKARELVSYCKRRGLLAALVERVIRDRPHLLVPA